MMMIVWVIDVVCDGQVKVKFIKSNPIYMNVFMCVCKSRWIQLFNCLDHQTRLDI